MQVTTSPLSLRMLVTCILPTDHHMMIMIRVLVFNKKNLFDVFMVLATSLENVNALCAFHCMPSHDNWGFAMLVRFAVWPTMFARGLKSLTFACIFLHYFRSLIEGKVACNGHLELYYILFLKWLSLMITFMLYPLVVTKLIKKTMKSTRFRMSYKQKAFKYTDDFGATCLIWQWS